MAQTDPTMQGGALTINPLAAGVTFGGLLLDFLLPRPKPRVGPVPGRTPPPRGRFEDTLAFPLEEHEIPPVASGASSLSRSVVVG